MSKNHKHWTFNLKILKYINVAEQLVKQRKKTPENKEKNTNQRVYFRITPSHIFRKPMVQSGRFLSFIDVNYLRYDTRPAKSNKKRKRCNAFVPLRGVDTQHHPQPGWSSKRKHSLLQAPRWESGSRDTRFDTFCFVFFLRRDVSSIDSSYAVQINTVANSTDTRTSEKQSGSKENGIT